MLRLSFVLMSLLPMSHALDISYFDSVTNPKLSWVLVDDCAVPVLKAKSKDTCYIIKKVNDFCHLDLNLKECKNGIK